MKANTKRMDKDGNKRSQGYRVYEITGDVPALGLGGGIAGASHLINDTRMIVGKLNSSQDGVVFDVHGEVQTLSAGHGNVPKILINEPIQNTVREGHAPYNTGGGRNSMTQKHSWDIIQVKSATVSGYEEAKEGDSVNYSIPNSATRRGRVGNQQAQTIDTAANQGVIVKVGKVSRSEEGKRLRKESMAKGKDHTPFQAKELDFIEQPEMNTITCATQKDNLLQEGYRIRRLTEIECERLQGFKDNHTMYGNYDGEVKKISRTQRYKMCGNAVTVDVVETIGNKLLNTLFHHSPQTTEI